MRIFSMQIAADAPMEWKKSIKSQIVSKLCTMILANCSDPTPKK